MEPEPPPGPPATLGEVRWLDAISLLASCKVCAHETVLNVDSLPDTVPLGSRHASCASAVTRSAHIFRLAGQRNQTGLIWPIICRDERARPADDARQYMRVGVRGFMKTALTCFALLVASGTTMAQQEFGLPDANVTRAVNELSGEMLE